MRGSATVRTPAVPAHYTLGVAREVADFPGRFPSITPGPAPAFIVSYVDGDALRQRVIHPDGVSGEPRTIPTHALVANSADPPSIVRAYGVM